MAGNGIIDIGWLNGQQNHLFVFDTDVVSLHKVENDFTKYSNYKVSTTASTLIHSSKQEECVRSVALDHSLNNHLAFGYSTGKISLVKADENLCVKPFRTEEVKELQKKSVACLSWNYYNYSQLGVGYEKGRGIEHSVIVHDVNRPSSSSRGLSQPSIFETNLPEKISDIGWFGDGTSLLVATAPRCLRLADIRERNCFHTNVTFQPALLGLCTDPLGSDYAAVYSRNTIFVLDRRFITFPIYEIPIDEAYTIGKVSWHRTRPYNLTCIMRETTLLYDCVISSSAFDNAAFAVLEKHGATLESVKQTFEAISTENRYSVLYNSVLDCNTLFSFDWHPTRQHELAVFCAARESDKRVRIVKQRNDVTTSISAQGEFAFVAGREFNVAGKYVVPQSEACYDSSRFESLSAVFAEPDMATLMRQRIQSGYGYGNTSNALFTIIERSKTAIENDEFANEDIRFCWRWMDHMFQLSEINDFVKLHSTHFPGIKHISSDMKSNSSIRNDEITYRNRIFTNEKRDRILKICGWPPFDDHSGCKAMLDEMMAQKNIRSQIRAAALALISIQGPTCKQYMQDICKFTLSDAFKETYDEEFVERYQKMVHSVTDILNTFNGIRIPDYDIICRGISDSYLLVILKYLARREGYNTIHGEIITLKDVGLEDKLAFAAIHMDDDSLNAALDKLLDNLDLEQRPLSGLLITGLDDQTDCHKLIHRYVDLTQDIQTASILLVVGNCFRKSKVLQDLSLLGIKVTELLTRAFDVEPTINARRRSLHCVRDYMELLSTWSFWLQKTFLASFLRTKTMIDTYLKSQPVSIQAVVVCNFCAMPIYPSAADRIDTLRTVATAFVTFPRRNEKNRVVSCPRCRRPLPKCIICRRHFGSQAEAISNGNDAYPVVHSAIDHWFVWCCYCNHGGHLSHIREWFKEYTVCPVSGCYCKCMDRDNQLRDEILTHLKEEGQLKSTKDHTKNTMQFN